MPIKYRENWVEDFAPKKINSDLGKVFWFAIVLALVFSSLFTVGLFVIWGHFHRQTVQLEEQSEELNREILCSLQRLELKKQNIQEMPTEYVGE